MWANVLAILFLFRHYGVGLNIVSEEDTTGLNIRFKQAINDVIKKIDNLAMMCPPGSFFYNGSCYFYLPPKQIDDNTKGIRFNDVSVDEAAARCRLLRAKLWDIETIDEFSFVLNRIYTETQSYDSPRIAINFTQGRRLLNLRKKINEQQYLFISNINQYSLIYKPLISLPAKNTCLIVDISKATRLVSLEEKFRLERRSDHYICKMRIDSCYNNTRCGHNGKCKNLISEYKCMCNFMHTGEHCEKLSSRGVQSIIGFILICLASLILLFLPIFHLLYQLKDKRKNSMQPKTSSRANFYSIPNLSSDELLKQADLTTSLSSSPPHIIVDFRRLSISSSTSSAIFFRHSYLYYLWRLFICLITITFATFCCYTIYEFKSENLKLINITNEKISSSNMCSFFLSNLNLYYKIPVNYISFIILSILILSLIFFENFSKKHKFKSCLKNFSLPMVFNSHSNIYRFESAAVFGIISLEILHIFDEFIINGAKHFQYGPLVDLLVQFGIGLMLGLRYFPVLAIFEQENNYENRLANIICYALASIYLYCEIVFKLQSDINCMIDKDKLSMIKQIFSKFNGMGINIQQYLMIKLGTNRTAQLNQTSEGVQSWFDEQIKKQLINSTYDDSSDVENDLTRLNNSLELNKQSILYNTLRYAPFYYFMVFLAVRLTVMFLNTFRKTINKKPCSFKSSPRWKYVKYNLLKSDKILHENILQEYSRLFRFLNYIIITFKQHVYCIRPYFRYSKLIVCIYTSAFTLIYYFTFWIQDHTYMLTKKLLLFLNLILCALADLSNDLCYNLDVNNIHRHIKYICLFTAFIICLQLFFGLKHYQIQMCNAYKGIFNDIPTPKQISSITIVSKSMHYPGRFMVIFFARLDYSPYGRGLEMYDSSYASYVSFFHIEKSQRHPVLNVFIDIVRQRLIDIRKLKYKLSIGKNQEKYEQDKLSQIRRFRWALAYTLIKNEQLKRCRKHRLCSNRVTQSKTLERIFDKIGLTQTLPRKF
ncbi:unnamed protein product [Rotaria socialis]|uniref:EGF-like domain-containing protein n=1 Tax=Rotaria socialis TaxID=392032 RepID=A0A817WR61_9BILA|nr:unnamed protein product [Rotaria socialis]CAF3358374.1 unnamed protein product [Rotaria socialis]